MYINFSRKLQFLQGAVKRLCHNGRSTIFALSSGHGKCGVAVIRISGPAAGTALKLITGLKDLPKPRYAVLKNIRHPQNGEILDRGLILWFPGPKSFTGEDSCELQVHGSIAVVNGIFKGLNMIPSLRVAEPGEFTKRAFFNGKLDLTQVEGLSDLLQAETEVQRKQAFLQSQGCLSEVYNKWKYNLKNILAHLEAFIDFDDTENLDNHQLVLLSENVATLSRDIKAHYENGHKGESLRTGVKTVIIGEPNVGKSSLLNLMCGRPAAIVSPIEGTTRDILEVRLDIGGYPVTLLDTAGLRKITADVIEEEGIKRALANYEDADLVILLLDAVKYSDWRRANETLHLGDYLKLYLTELGLRQVVSSEDQPDATSKINKPFLIVLNKLDLIIENIIDLIGEDVAQISCKTENGIDHFFEVLAENIKNICANPSREHPSMNQARHRQHLTDCIYEIDLFINKSENNVHSTDVVILAEHLRRALKHLGKLVGTVTSEEILDIIFKDFCIGK